MRKFYSYIVAVLLMAGSLNVWAENVEVSDSYTFDKTSGNASWSSDNSSSYCGAFGNKTNSFYVANNSISNFSSVNFSLVSNPSVTISVTALTNNGTNSYTVSLINSSGTVVGTPVTKTDGMGNGTNAASASESTVTLTPVAGTTGYRIDFPAKAAITATGYTLTYTTGGSTPIVNITTTPINVTSTGGSGSLDIAHNLTVSSTSNFGCTFYAEDGTTALTGDAIPTWVGQSITGNNTDGYIFNYNISSYTGTTDQVARVKVYGMSNGSEEKVYSDLLTIKQTAKHTVTFNLSGGTFSSNSDFSSASVEKESGTYHLPSATKAGNAFDGWNDGSQTYAADAEYTVSANVTFTAQWRTLHTYTLVTSVDDIVPGKHYIIANDTCGNKYAMGGVSSNNNYRERVAVEIYKTNGIIKIAETEGVYEFVISGKDNDDYWTIYDEAQASNHYLAATGNSSNNNMGVVSTAEDRSKWTIEIGADTTATIVAPLITGNDKRSHIRYNTASGQERFSCYKEGSTLPKVYLYVKDNETDGTIYSATTLSKNESYNNLTIVKTVVNNNPVVNGSITVPNAKTLTVTGTLTNQGDAANLIIEDGGKLITKSSGVNATVKKNVAAATNWGTTGDSYTPDGWYFIASPVDDAAFPTGSVNDQDIYQLDWANNNWINLQYSGHSTLLTAGFQRGTGYLYASQAGNTLSVAGEIQPLSNDDNATVTLANNGWNLIGNPLTCAVTVSTAFSELNNESSVTNMDANSVINPFQGIAVNGTAGDVVTFTKAASQNAVGPNNGYGNLQLTLAQNIVTRGTTTTNTIDNAVISFNEGSVLPKFNMLEGNAKLYIPQGTEEYAIVSAEAQGEMPVNFRAAKDGEYTLTVNAENVEMNYLHLIDNLTGADVDLLATPSYTFSARTTDYASRFRLLFGANDENGASTSSATFAYVSNGQVVVNGTGILQVVDMLGRIVASQEVTTANCQLSTANYKTGVYVLRLVNNGDVKTQKMVIE